MEQEPKEKEAVCSSAPAPGYATATDAALDWFANPRANPHAVATAIGHEGWPHAVSIKAGEALAAEVRRLRGRVEELEAQLAELNALMADSSRLDWLDKRLDYFGRISLRLQGNPERCIIAEEAPDECGNYHNGDEIGSSAGKLLRSAIDAGMSHNEVAERRAQQKGNNDE